MTKKSIHILILITFLTIVFPLKSYAEQLYIPYNIDEWFSKWRQSEFDSNPVDFCIIIDESSSTINSDPTKIRHEVVKKFINGFSSEDRIALVEDNGAQTEENLLSHALTQDKNSVIESISPIGKYHLNSPIYSVEVCLKQLATGESSIRNKSIIHLGDGAFGYVYSSFYSPVIAGEFPIDESIIDSIKDYGIKVYTVGFTNKDSDYPSIEEVGSLKRFAEKNNGKYYRLKIGEGEKTSESETDINHINSCNNKEYATKNVGKCCKEYPETCCLESSFIDNSDNWNTYFSGENSWRKDVCCANKDFTNKYSEKCKTDDTGKTKDPVKETLSCSDPTYSKNNYCKCKPLICNEDFAKDCIGKLIYDIYQMIKIIVTVLLVVLTTIDFLKATVSKDDEARKKCINTAIRRTIIVVILLFAPSILNFLLKLISGGKWSTCGIR